MWGRNPTPSSSHRSPWRPSSVPALSLCLWVTTDTPAWATLPRKVSACCPSACPPGAMPAFSHLHQASSLIHWDHSHPYLKTDTSPNLFNPSPASLCSITLTLFDCVTPAPVITQRNAEKGLFLFCLLWEPYHLENARHWSAPHNMCWLSGCMSTLHFENGSVYGVLTVCLVCFFLSGWGLRSWCTEFASFATRVDVWHGLVSPDSRSLRMLYLFLVISFPMSILDSPQF